MPPGSIDRDFDGRDVSELPKNQPGIDLAGFNRPGIKLCYFWSYVYVKGVRVSTALLI